MRLSRGLSLVVGVVLAGCGGATEGVPGSSGGSSSAASGTSGSSGTRGQPTDCPHVVTLKSFPKTLTRDEVCAVEREKKFESHGFSWEVVIDSVRCAELCGDPMINTCEMAHDNTLVFGTIYGHGPNSDRNADGGAGTCPFAEKVSPLDITCKQDVQRGTPSNDCPPSDG